MPDVLISVAQYLIPLAQIICINIVLIGYIGGEMAVTDPVIKDWIDLSGHPLHVIMPIAYGILVLLLGRSSGARKRQL
jgi:hypothetical protein